MSSTSNGSRLDLNRVRRVVGGGVAGTVVMVVVLLVGAAEARFQLGIGNAIARYVGVPGLPVVGLFLFFGFGIVVWPLVFLLVDEPLKQVPGGGDPAVRGMVFSVPLWVLYVVLGVDAVNGLLFYLHVVFTLFAHLLYGFTLGAVYYSLSERL